MVTKRSLIPAICGALVLGLIGCTPVTRSPSPIPTQSAEVPHPPPSPEPGHLVPGPRSATNADGLVTVLSSREPSDSPIAHGVLGPPAPAGYDSGIVAGSGPDGSFLIAYSPLPPDEEIDFDALVTYQSGLGQLGPDGSIEWLLPPPVEAVPGPAITEATADEHWVVWLENDSSYLDSWPYRMWARPRDGGPAMLLSESEPLADGRHVAPPGFMRDPLILGQRVFWVDVLPNAAGDLDTAVVSTRLDGSEEPRVEVASAWGLRPDLCAPTGEVAMYYLLGGYDVDDPPSVHRREVGPGGDERSDTIVWQDDRPESNTAGDVAACGTTSAVLRETPESESTDDFTAWIEITTAHGSRSYVWPEGSGSSLTSLTVTPDIVTWAAFNGEFEGSRYIYSMSTDQIYQLPTDPGLSRLYASASSVHWHQSSEGGTGAVGLIAPIRRPDGAGAGD